MFGAKLVTALVTFFFGLIEVLLVFRIILLLLGANLNAPFSNWILANTDSLVAPFQGIFPSPSLAGTFSLDTAAIFALVVYAVAAFLISQVIEMFEGVDMKPSKKTKEK